MAKPGLAYPEVPALLRERQTTTGWALCVGSGTSSPAFPMWTTLVERLIAKDVGDECANTLSKAMLQRFSADSLIQAASDRLGASPGAFAEVLTSELYRDIRHTLTESEWHVVSNALASYSPGVMDRKTRLACVDIIRSHYPGMSAIPIAEIIAETLETPLAPSSILTFNAEPMLPTLIALFASRKIADGSSKRTIRGEQVKHLDLVTGSTSYRKDGRVPVYFCHGLLPVPASHHRTSPRAVDKLVFSESEYLQLANTAYSWQASAFLDAAAFRTVVFVGVSMSDPNLRRWLSVVHENRRRELRERYDATASSTFHYWICRQPSSDVERQWVEASVAHLGVRLVWIPRWSEVGPALQSMLGMMSSTGL